MKLAFRLLAAAAFAGACLHANERQDLDAYAQFESRLINESSGLVKSRQHENLYWTHNDSGDTARIFPVNRQGQLVRPAWLQGEYPGLAIGGATNIDWEDIATDNSGRLYIGAFGNNGNARRDLAIYVVPEPHPQSQMQSRALKTIPIAYPEQQSFPPPKSKWDFDCEALFWANDKLYLLTKNRGDHQTKLYRLDSTNPNEVNLLTLIGRYDVGGLVTAADALPDGSKIAVLCYHAVFVFEKPANSDNYLAGPASMLPIRARQCEAIAFDGPDTLIITNEQTDLFELPLSTLKPLN